MGPTTAYFCLFRSFQHKLYNKNCRLQGDLNSDHRYRRRANWSLDHHHGPQHGIVANIAIGRQIMWQNNHLVLLAGVSDLGQCCGSVGRAVTSDTRFLRFESSHRQSFVTNIFTVEKRKFRKRGREWPNF